MSDVQARIADDVKSNDVLLYMKGTPAFPQCGFSAVTVQILSHIGVKFKAVNVLEDPEVREGIKTFSNWPTIPQLYVKGEFVGGADIVREMFEQQELVPFFEQRGVHSVRAPGDVEEIAHYRNRAQQCVNRHVHGHAHQHRPRHIQLGGKRHDVAADQQTEQIAENGD